VGSPRVTIGSPPTGVPATHLKSGAFNNVANADSSVLPVDVNLPYVVLYNADTVLHVITATLRSGPDLQGAAIPFNLAAGGLLPLPTAVIGSLVDGSPNGTIYWFYSDVPLSGFRGPAGSGAPSVPGNTIPEYTPSSNGTPLMAGMGSFAKITPRVTGIVQVTFFGELNQGGVNHLVTVGAAFGIGAAPAQNAAAAGTVFAFQDLNSSSIAGLLHVPFCFTVVLALSVGANYWFDCQVQVAANTDGVTLYLGGIVELAQ
jgi:hypothetical protein